MTIPSKNVLFVIEEFNPSGGLKIVSAIANTLAEAGYEVQFLAPRTYQKPFYPLNDTIRVNYLGSEKFGGRWYYFLKLLLRDKTYQSLTITPNYRIAALWGKCTYLKAGFVFLIQGDDAVSLIKHSTSNAIEKYINTLFLNRSRKILANRIFVSRFLQDKSPKKGTYIPNFISDFLLNSPKRVLFSDKNIRIGTVSTSAPNKGFDFFLQCMEEINRSAKLSDRTIQFKCATQDQSLIQECISNGIEYCSPKTEGEMSDFYQSCDFYISCSISEGFNLPVLEAMASGCIVFATNDGGVTDFVSNGTDGFLFDVRNAGLIAEKLINQLSNRSELIEMQQKALQKAKQFSLVTFKESYLNYFKAFIH